jgi:hypothetical protein
MNPQHLKLLSGSRDLYRHLIALAFPQHGPAQRGIAADDLNELSAADQSHAASIRSEKDLLLPVVGIHQADQRTELYTFAGVVGACAELAPIGHCLADGFGATSLAGGQVSGFESQCVVFVFGDVFFMSRRFMGRSHCLFSLQQIFGEPFQHLLLQQEFIHDEVGTSNKRGSGFDYEGLHQSSTLLLAEVDLYEGGCLPLRLTLTGFKGIRSGLRRQRLRRLCAKPTTGRGRFQTVAQAA